MRALEIQELRGPDGVALVERPEPEPNGRVVIDVRAAGVSFPDLLIAKGMYQEKPDLPHVPGQEVAGVVRSAPEGASVKPGDRVWASMHAGGFAEVATARPEHVFPLSDKLSFEEGAALSVNFLTAIFALGRRGQLREGETVVVIGAAGGLGSACVSVAKAYGARVIAIVSTDDKADTARAAGADEVVVGEEWRDSVLKLTDGRGANMVADVVGAGQTLQAVRSTAPEGRVLVLGFTGGSIPEIATNRLLLRNVSLVGVGLGALDATDPSTLPTTGAELTRLVEAGLRPVVGHVLPLAEGAEGLRILESRRAKGKVVLTM
jgi:NADPH2:quinone reductase